MKNKIYFNKPYVSINDLKYVKQVFKKNKFADGDFQRACESFIKKKLDSKFIALTQNCSSALEIAMMLIKLKKNDEVIMPSYTFTSTANAVLLRGAKPVFVDIGIKDLNLDPKLVESKINKKTKAILLVHYAGSACDMKYFLKLKKKHNLFLIEDCAHAFLGKYANNHLGTIGDFGAFSFHETKNFVGGQCGALSINNLKFVNRAKILLDKGTDRSFIGDKKKYYSWKGVGSEFRSAELPAALLYSQLLKSKKIQIMREKIWNYYYDNLRNKNNNKYYILSKNIKNKSGFHVFAIIFKGLSLREKFINFMKKKGIYCFFHYYPLHLSTFGKKFSSHRLLNTEKVYNGLVRLPLYPSLKKKELKKIMKETSNFLK